MQQDNTIPQSPQNSPQFSAANNPSPQPTSPQNNSPKKQKRWLSFLSNFGIIIAAPLIALLLINFVFQSYEVDGPSMEETLHHQDRLVVVKLGKTYADLRNRPYIPDRGSVVIFHRVESSQFGDQRQLIKRVVGLPGERVVVVNNQVTVYNEENPDGFNPDHTLDYGETIDELTPGRIDLTVPKGEVFVLGDNRDNSADSRAFGTIKSEDIVGELALRMYPFSDFKVF